MFTDAEFLADLFEGPFGVDSHFDYFSLPVGEFVECGPYFVVVVGGVASWFPEWCAEVVELFVVDVH